MKRIIPLILVFLAIFCRIPVNAQVILMTEEAHSAFEYLNRVRQDPAAFSDEIGIDLGYVDPRPALKWNDRLAGAAERKAMDMAGRDYFGHTDPEGFGMNYRIFQAGYTIPKDWFEDLSNNYFESIQAGHSTGRKAIADLIIDEGLNPPGHRNHLLGIEDFWSNCADIGIGMASKEGSTYTYYMCVLIAKHDF